MARGANMIQPLSKELIYKLKQQSKMTALWLLSLFAGQQRQNHEGNQSKIPVKTNPFSVALQQCWVHLSGGFWFFLLKSYKVYYPSGIHKTLRSSVCGPISGEH